MSSLFFAPLLTLLVAADGAQSAAESYPVELRPGAEGSKLAPRFSPKGTPVALTPKPRPGLAGLDHLEGRLRLGPKWNRGEGQLIVLARSTKEKPYDLLFVDAGHDGSVADDQSLTATSATIRGKFWSNFATTLRVNHAPAGRPPAWEEYPVSFWVVAEKADETPAVIRYTRHGFLAGSVTLAGVAHDVVLTDGDNDAVYGRGDSWTVRPAGEAGSFAAGQSRSVGDFAWAGGKAWKLELEGTDGRRGRLVRFDPGVTEEADATRRDLYREDRLAPRAAKPAEFRKDVDEAVKDALDRKKPYFLKFETDWCVPCKQMHAYVFTARDVADSAAGVVCVTVDGDKRKDLVEQYKVQGYPTGILFGPAGTEVARFSGYRGVKDMTAFFRKAAEAR